MGFEYEIFKRLANHLNVRLEIVLAKNVDSIIPMLNRGDGDIIALGYTITAERKEDVNFTDPYMITHQSLIQKKPDNWRKMTVDNIKNSLATDIIDLIISPILDFFIPINTSFIEYFLCSAQTYSIDVSQANFASFVSW